MVYFPRARILSLVVLGFLITTTEISAFVDLTFWFLLQAISGLMSLGRETATRGLAW
jgi:hypothetical protein